MDEKQTDILLDLAGFIGWSISHDMSYWWVIANLSHDMNGIVAETPHFLPRTHGFRTSLEKSWTA